MQPDPITCALHEQKIAQILAAVKDLSGQMGDAARNQAVIVESLAGLRREMDVGFQGVYRRQDATNGRVTTLESKTGRLEADMAAQEAFTPGLFKALEDLSSKKSCDHERIWTAIESLKASDQADHERVANEKGWRGGAVKMVALAWMTLLTLIAAAAWLVERIFDSVKVSPKP